MHRRILYVKKSDRGPVQPRYRPIKLKTNIARYPCVVVARIGFREVVNIPSTAFVNEHS
jgi:hypothetical protein